MTGVSVDTIELLSVGTEASSQKTVRDGVDNKKISRRATDFLEYLIKQNAKLVFVFFMNTFL